MDHRDLWWILTTLWIQRVRFPVGEGLFRPAKDIFDIEPSGVDGGKSPRVQSSMYRPKYKLGVFISQRGPTKITENKII